MSEAHAPLYRPGKGKTDEAIGAREVASRTTLAPFAQLEKRLACAETEWARAEGHQFIFLSTGVLHLEVEGARWFLPPRRAAWLRDGARHRFTWCTDYEARRVVLPQDGFNGDIPDGDCCVFAPSVLAEELFEHALRFPPGAHTTTTSTATFDLIAGLSTEWIGARLPLCLPTPRSPELSAAMSYTLESLGAQPTIEEAARAARLSTRSLARRFQEEAGTTWRKYLHDARMIRAMELLSTKRARIEDAARSVGFESAAAFSRAFEAFTSEKPKDYRRRFTS